MKNCSKIKNTCGTRIVAECVDYESAVNTNSSLAEMDCLTIEETTSDIYTQLEQINLSALGEECLTYVEDENGKLIVKNVLLKFEEKICELLAEVEALKNRQLCDIPISDCVTSLDCLVGECDNSIITLGDWMAAVQAKICTL